MRAARRRWGVPRTLRVVAGLSLTLLAACQTVPPPLAGDRAAPPRWDLEGRLALSNGRDGGSGRLAWSHGPERDRLRFHGALGRGSWRLVDDGGGAVLETGDGRRWTARDTAGLVRDRLGWDLPVGSLASWVVGEPAAGRDYAVLRDRSGRLELLEQGGWTIRYEGYAEHGGRWMPRKLIARRGGDELRLIVSRWSFPPGPAVD